LETRRPCLIESKLEQRDAPQALQYSDESLPQALRLKKAHGHNKLRAESEEPPVFDATAALPAGLRGEDRECALHEVNSLRQRFSFASILPEDLLMGLECATSEAELKTMAMQILASNAMVPERRYQRETRKKTRNRRSKRRIPPLGTISATC